MATDCFCGDCLDFVHVQLQRWDDGQGDEESGNEGHSSNDEGGPVPPVPPLEVTVPPAFLARYEPTTPLPGRLPAATLCSRHQPITDLRGGETSICYECSSLLGQQPTKQSSQTQEYAPHLVNAALHLFFVEQELQRLENWWKAKGENNYGTLVRFEHTAFKIFRTTALGFAFTVVADHVHKVAVVRVIAR